MNAVHHRVLHVSGSPADTQLLQSQLETELVGATIQRVDDVRSLVELVNSGSPELLVVDLPLGDESLDLAVGRVQAERPELSVLFRWHAGGTWQYAEDSEPLANIVRQTLRLEPARPQDAEERRRTLDRIVRGQEVLLRLTQTDFWEFEEGLRAVTATLARLLQVERVSVWEFDPTLERLRCLDLYESTPDRHSRRQELADFPRYLRALSTSLMVATSDARQDPRTSEFADNYLTPLGITSMLDAPIRRRGKVRGVLCIEHVGPQRSWDVIEQCQASSAANLLAQALELRDRRALEHRLEESQRLAAIGRTAARLAHDFNNRLMVIGSELELAAGDGHISRSALETLRSEIEKARESARNLMNLRRERREAPVPLALGPRLEALRPSLRALLGPEIELTLVLSPEPLHVVLAAADFEQVLVNLATNARDALPRGGSVRITLTRAEAARRALLTVEDNGTGMDAETRAHLFEPFATTKSATEGSGLGLASVFAVVQEARGEITVDSVPGLGTRFRIELPLA
jgi:signal transduction histidine kinase